MTGYLQLAVQLQDNPERFNGAWNFGPSSTEVRKVIEVAEHIVSAFGYGKIEIVPTDGKQHEASLLQLNCDKAHQVLSWYPRWDFEHTLNMTSDWYKQIYAGAEAKKVTLQQVHEYFPEIGR